MTTEAGNILHLVVFSYGSSCSRSRGSRDLCVMSFVVRVDVLRLVFV